MKCILASKQDGGPVRCKEPYVKALLTEHMFWFYDGSTNLGSLIKDIVPIIMLYFELCATLGIKAYRSFQDKYLLEKMMYCIELTKGLCSHLTEADLSNATACATHAPLGLLKTVWIVSNNMPIWYPQAEMHLQLGLELVLLSLNLFTTCSERCQFTSITTHLFYTANCTCCNNSDLRTWQGIHQYSNLLAIWKTMH